MKKSAPSKKRKITPRDIIFLAFVLLLSAAVVVCVVHYTGKTKKVIAPKTLETKLKDLGYRVTDRPKSSIADPRITRAFIAEEGGDFIIEFYMVDSEEHAKVLFEKQIEIKEKNLKENGRFTEPGKIKQGENYTRYVLDNDSDYIVITRVEDTYLVIDTGSENKTEVNRVLNKLGY